MKINSCSYKIQHAFVQIYRYEKKILFGHITAFIIIVQKLAFNLHFFSKINCNAIPNNRLINLINYFKLCTENHNAKWY